MLAARPDERRALAAAAAALLLLVAAITAPLLGTGFFGDDPGHLHAVALHAPWEFLVSPRATADLGGPFFTPLLGVSLAVDWRLFGLDPCGYGVHGALALWALGLAVLALLRTLGAPAAPAALGAAAVIANPATVAVAAWFSTRHYLEGAVWAVLACTCAVLAARRRRLAPLAAAAGLGLAALLSKEIFVPLPALCLPLLPGLPRRWRRLLGGAAAAVIAAYALLRLALAGGVAGYHGIAELSAAGAARAIGSSAGALFGALFWPAGRPAPAAAVAAGGVLLAACGVAAWRRARLAGVGALALVLAAALAPVSLVLLFQGGAAISGELAGGRLAFPLALALTVAAGALAAAPPAAAGVPAARPRAAGLLLVLLAATLPGSVATVSAWRAARARAGAELDLVRARWRDSALVVSVEGVGVFRAGTRLLLGMLCPGPHLLLLGDAPVPLRELRSLHPADFYWLPDDLAGRPARTPDDVAALVGRRHAVLADAPPARDEFSLSLAWTGDTYGWRLSPPSYRYFHLWEPLAAAAPGAGGGPCGDAVAPPRERAVGEYLAIPPVGALPRATLARRGVTALRARVRAVDATGAYRDSPDFLVDLATPGAVAWSSGATSDAPAPGRSGGG